MLSTESIVVELFGIGFVFVGSIILHSFLTFGQLPYFISLQSVSPHIAFAILPSLVYLVTRFYCWSVFKLSDRIFAKISLSLKVRENLQKIFSTSAIIIALSFLLRIKPVQVQTSILYDQIVGDLPKILLDHGAPDRVRMYELLKKMIGLIGGWFVLLFIIERASALLLLIISWTIRSLLTSSSSLKATSSSKPKNSRRKRVSAEDDDDEEEEEVVVVEEETESSKKMK